MRLPLPYLTAEQLRGSPSSRRPEMDSPEEAAERQRLHEERVREHNSALTPRPSTARSAARGSTRTRTQAPTCRAWCASTVQAVSAERGLPT